VEKRAAGQTCCKYLALGLQKNACHHLDGRHFIRLRVAGRAGLPTPGTVCRCP
jgi:hypothetical protein